MVPYMRSESLPNDLNKIEFGFSKTTDGIQYLTSIQLSFRKSEKRIYATTKAAVIVDQRK